MAERYGGKFSPQGGDSGDGWDGKIPARAGGRVNLLFLAPIPLVPLAFFQDPTGLAQKLVAFGILMLAAWLTREGVRAHAAFDARKVAKRPAIPRKIFGAVLVGAGLAVAGFSADLIAPAIFAILGFALHLMAFGPDPLHDKGAEGIDSFQVDRVARVVDEAESYLGAMQDAIARAHDRQATARVGKFTATARKMCRTVEDDPRDLTAARRYLGVYLLGARDATIKYADIATRGGDASDARKDYLALLDDLEQGFAARTSKLLLEDRADLDVEIDVLRDRLAREGLNPTGH